LTKKQLKLFIKIILSIIAVFVVFQKIELEKLKDVLLNVSLFWLVLGFLAFNLSKIVSAVRLNVYFDAIGLKLSEVNNLQLYYVGMFYNLFLPGGIGGDGYKIYYLNKKYSVNIKYLFQAILLDRISGLAALVFFAGVLFCTSKFFYIFKFAKFGAILAALLVFPFAYLMTKYMFKRFLNVFKTTTILGIAVQFFQLISAYFLVNALSEGGLLIEYLTLFLISSVVAVLPISIGGIGLRELTFLYGFELINQDVNSAVSFSLLFFAITAVSSLLGIFALKKF